MQEVDLNALITKGMPLSQNFILDHVSTGAYHYLMGQWTPQFTAMIKPFAEQNMPMWQLVRNLQMGTENILEPMLKEFGQDLILRAAFTPGNLGLSFDIQVKGFQSNMFNVMEDLQTIAMKASSISMVQGATSFARINFDMNSVTRTIIQELPPLQTIDALTNTTIKDLVQIKGFI